MEIDIAKLFKAILRGWKIIVATVAIFAVLAFVITKFFITPMYKSNTLAYIKLSDNVITSTGIALARDMVATYVVILTSDQVVYDTYDNVKDKTSRVYSPNEIKNMISAEGVNETEVLCISVVCENPKDAQIIADQLVVSVSDAIKKNLNAKTFSIIDYASLPTAPVSPSIPKNLVVSVMLAVVLSAGGILLVEILDKRIKRNSDITETLNVPVVGVIPNIE